MKLELLKENWRHNSKIYTNSYVLNEINLHFKYFDSKSPIFPTPCNNLCGKDMKAVKP